jgi:EAL and modified HD-GYP domain-containing signal transduction protein
VPLSDNIKNALLKHEGRCGMLYDLVLSYETADWGQITKLAEELDIPNNVLTTVYFVCMENVNTLWEQLSSAGPWQDGEAPESGDGAEQPVEG